MIVFACDTSTKTCSAALLDGKILMGERMETGKSAFSTVFMPMVEGLFSSCGISHADIDLYICTSGPGSFTGLRIGVAATQAMAYASGRPAIGVSTLEALAWPLLGRENAIVCPVLDARNGRIYGEAILSGYAGGAVPAGLPAANVRIEAFIDQLTVIAGDRQLLFCGDAADACALLAASILGERSVPPPAHISLRAEWVGLSGLDSYGSGPADRYPPHLLLPVYLGRSQAERTTGIDASAWASPGFTK
ncbi:MAG TPA: tRNA (adenosine(37)-N6)-threonylcarbamoyltransferase complex dimerization subunit type 1 TsaB [Clostridia bacterium]